MPNIKFFSDENVDDRLVKFLLEEGIDITYAERGVNNSKLYSLACKEGRAILSRDKDFTNTALFPPSKLPAVIVMRMHPFVVSKVKSVVLEFIKKLSDEVLGKTWELREDGATIVG